MHEVEPRAAARERGEEPSHHCIERVGEIVVADPVLEEITQDVERLRRARFFLEEIDEAFVRLGTLRAEVQVRDEELHYFWPTSVTDSISTGFTGTSRFAPRLAVGDATILFTTSMPSTTLPNTV